MKLQRFFINEKIVAGESLNVSDKELTHQIRKVFRMKAGDKVGLLDKNGQALEATVASFGKDEVSFDVSAVPVSVFLPTKKVTLFVCIPKKDKFETVCEKATELGVTKIVPVISNRTEKQNFKKERLEKIIKEASEQSERGNLLLLGETISIEEVPENIFALDMNGEEIQKTEIKNQKDVSVIIGPEGGFDQNDLNILKRKNIKIVSLGKQVLRAETASIAISSVLLLD